MKEVARSVESTRSDAPVDAPAGRRPELLLRWARWAVRRLRPELPPDQREDVLQSTLTRLIEIERSTGAIRSQEYILRTVHSVTIDEVRRRAREVAHLQARSDEPGSLPEAPEELRDLSTAVDTCLQGLSLDRRRTVFLHLQGFGSSEIAKLLAMDRKQVRNHTFRGMSELRSLLREKGYG
jgi:RNA polymerase sigma factor (sigma-70 family)